MFEAAAIQPFSPIALFTANAASHPVAPPVWH